MIPQLNFLGISRNLLKLGANRLPRELSIKLPTVLEFDIALTRSSNAAERSMHDAMFLATSAHNAMRASPAPLGQVQEVVEASSRLVDETRLILDPWISLLDKIESLIGVVDKISEVESTSYMSSSYTEFFSEITRYTHMQKLHGVFCLPHIRFAYVTMCLLASNIAPA